MNPDAQLVRVSELIGWFLNVWNRWGTLKRRTKAKYTQQVHVKQSE